MVAGWSAMVRGTEIASFRRVTPAILASARLAMANDIPESTKAEVAILLKKAAPILGIDGSTYHIMDILIGLSRADDWAGTNRPIVAISNAKLAEYTGRSERQVTRCIRRLVEAGVIAYRDSPTGRRFVYRDKDGDISKGYGLDFTPARVRLHELKTLVEDFQARLNSEQEARRIVSRTSRAIVDACAAYPEHAEAWHSELQGLKELGLDKEGEAEALEAMHARIILAVTEEYVPHKMSGEGDISVTSIIYTTPQNSLECKKKWARSNERELKTKFSGRTAAGTSTERKSGAVQPESHPPVRKKSAGTVDEIQSQVLASVSVGLVRSACRQACEMVGTEIRSWPELAAAASTMRLMIGLSEAGWLDGTARVGRFAAAAILATVLEKAARSPDQITSPGGYFRAMIDRAVEGNLHLEKSLFGLADGVIKQTGERPA
ncbi:hypothetical protein ShzoTeo12_54650 (plasmid) [Shinella zoogloeoides]|nr:hypothetical protein ShzoTeo12_54650 [Shinella zoogloeoides]